MDSKEKYYIGGKMYLPDESEMLCTVQRGDEMDLMAVPERQALYRTERGAYFLVSSSGDGVQVALMDKTAAFEFMDQHAAGINTETYDRLFGEPERG